MAKINILDSSIYNLIAAGEVVERPASVVKELVENSIDAGATNINIEIKNGGISYIQVSDDGFGIDEDDIVSAFLPHATSKIKNAKDLESILTLGFRGEALASIAAVSKVKLVSRTASSDIGSSIEVEGGKFDKVKKVSCNEGTTITVSDLFYCVPARAKFLKKSKTEEQEITNIITRTILAHPSINIVYIVDGKKIFSSLGKTEKEAMFSIYGKESVSETLEVSATKDTSSVFGYVGKPTYSKSNRSYQTLIINGRYVINLTVQTAVANAYGDFLMKRQYPFFVLYLTIPPEEVDVNVHPNKLDVKFLNSSKIYSLVFEAVSRGLSEMDYVKQVELEDDKNIYGFGHPNAAAKIDKAGVNLNPYSDMNYSETSDEQSEKLKESIIDSILHTSSKSEDKVCDNFGLGSKLLEKLNSKVNSNESKNRSSVSEVFYENNFDDTDEKTANFINKNLNFNTKSSNSAYKQGDFAEDEIKIIGKLFNTYMLIEWGNNLYLIDQHAAHERLRYDKLKMEYETKKIILQPLLVPYVLSLNVEDDQIISDNLEAIKSVGFEIEDFGERTYKISTVPAIVSDIDFNKFFSMFLAEKLNKTKLTEAELVKDSLMQMACKSAVKGGDDLSRSEIKTLLDEMYGNSIILFCPHGRPVVVRVSKSEIEKWFKRIV